MTTAAPTKAEIRKQAQCERILAAAHECFVRYGFHNASMASIAEAADMSPGLIYRYFENKNAIILAIIEQQLDITRQRIRELRSAEDLCEGIIEYYDKQDCGDPDSMSTALFLEMSAEATRDEEIAQAIRRFDNMVRQEATDWLARDPAEGGHGLPKDVARARALALNLFIEGLKARKTREPDIDRECLLKAVKMIVSTLTRS